MFFELYNFIIKGVESMISLYEHIIDVIKNIKYLYYVEYKHNIFVRKRLFHKGYEVTRSLNYHQRYTSVPNDGYVIYEHIKYVNTLEEI